MNPLYPATQRRTARIVAALADGPANIHELASASFTSVAALRKYLRFMLADRLIYISKWERYGINGVFIPLYAAGNRPSAEKPSPLTAQQKNAKFHKRRINDAERHAFWLARRRARDAANRPESGSKPVTWLSALGVTC